MRELDMVAVHTCEPSGQTAEVRGLRSPGQLGQHSDFQDSLSYTERPCLKTMYVIFMMKI